MDAKKIEKFMQLAGQDVAASFTEKDLETRKLGAQLLLSEVLEYVTKGLGLKVVIGGVEVSNPNALDFNSQSGSNKSDPNKLEMLDGLADVAYTMYWNACAFGLPLEAAFDLVCDNNLEKFVPLPAWRGPVRQLRQEEWDCGQQITWPKEVVAVQVIPFRDEYYAVGKDAYGKVRKPSSYRQVELAGLLT